MYSAVFFINPSFVSMGPSSITNLETTPLATPHLSFLFFLAIHSLSRGFSISSFRRVHFFPLIQTTDSLPDCHYLPFYRYLLMLRCLSLCLYHHFLPSLFFLLFIIYSNPVTCQCRSDSSELQGWLQWDKLYTITGRERKGARYTERGANELDTNRSEELNTRVAQEPPVTVTDRRRPCQGTYSCSVDVLNIIGFKHWVCVHSIFYPILSL